MFRNLKRNKRILQNRSYKRSGHFTLSSETKQGIAIVILFTISFLSLLSFFQATGTMGHVITGMLAKIFGWGDWIFPVLLLFLCYQLLRPGRYDIKLINYIGLVLTVFGYSGLMHLVVRNIPLQEIMQKGAGGGFVGYAVGNWLFQLTAFWGALLILIAVLVSGLMIFLNTSLQSIVVLMRQAGYAISSWFTSIRQAKKTETSPVYTDNFQPMALGEEEPDEVKVAIEEPEQDTEETEEKPTHHEQPQRKIRLPKIDIPLDLLIASTEVPSSGDIKANMKKIEETLRSFGIEVTMGEVNVGPTVSQYTLKPTEGVKLTQITALHNDLALALAAHPIRIEAPIPGKSLVGIEVPNQTKSIVKLREILGSSVYANRKSNLMLALGKDVSGKVMMADLDKMPHLLIAGATGSGKSVCINSMLISLLYQNSPDILKIILVDPKRVELSSYGDIPHLLAPVIIEVDKTINALRWAVHTMDERYKLLSAAGKKNIQSYNEARLLDKMPYIVIVIDELADLMMTAAKDVESAIIRLAQMARAVGIHLILATQRPSVNVITGLIKANITSRIAFAVASSTDSRTIIDTSGADKLLGNGDMLYISAELSKPKRIQGAFVTDTEITAVTDYLKARGEPQYDIAVTERRHNLVSPTSGYESDDEECDLRDAALAVIKAKRASATLLQSRMRIGFAKASRLLDILEERGIIGPQNSSKPREVLMSQQEFERQFGEALETEELMQENINESFNQTANDESADTDPDQTEETDNEGESEL